MDTKTIAKDVCLFSASLINLVFINPSTAQHQACNNYWINPSSGKEECFQDAANINVPISVPPVTPSSNILNNQKKEECLLADCNNNVKTIPLETKALFATILPTGVIPVADRPILVIPCAPINENCKEAESYLVEILNKTKNLNNNQINQLNQKIKNSLLGLQQAEEFYTDLRGEVTFNCPTVNCLIYTNLINEKDKLFWVKLHEQGIEKEYPPSTAIKLETYSVSPSINNLNQSIAELKSQMGAGISYNRLPIYIAAFNQALEEAENSQDFDKYPETIVEAARISILLSILSNTWELYIQSTDTMGYKETHIISCKNARILRDRWNDTLGYEDLGKVKGGILGCIGFDITGLPERMISVISSKLNNISNFKNQNVAKVPEISIPKTNINQ